MAMYVYEETTNILFKEHFEKSAVDYRRFWQEICAKYPGWTADFVYRNAEPPMEFIKEIGARLLEALRITILTGETFSYSDKTDATPVNAENFHIFARLHKNIDPEFAHPNERIAGNLDRWRIFMKGSAYVMMSYWSKEPEIFALVAKDAHEGALLLAAAAKYAFADGLKKLDFYVDVDAPMEMEAAAKIGFTETGKSIAYRVDSIGS